MHACVRMFVCVCAFWRQAAFASSASSSSFPPSLLSDFLIVGQPLCLPPQVAIMSGMIPMSRLHAPLRADKNVSFTAREAASPFSHPLVSTPAPSLSLQVDGAEVLPCDITALGLFHGCSGFSTTD